MPETFATIREITERRVAEIQGFANLVESEPMLERAKDDRAFSQILSLTLDYGLRQADISARLAVSLGSVSRWAHQRTMPPAYARRAILQALATMLTEHAQKMRQRLLEV